MKIVNYVGDNPDRFSSLCKVFLYGTYRLSQRASWAVNYCVRSHPDFILDRFDELLEMLDRSHHDAVKRNILRMLQYVDIPTRWQGSFYTRCLHFLGSSKEPIAVRVFSMQLLYNIAKGTPELEEELRQLLRDIPLDASPALHARSRNLLKELG
ncbi:MAG: hypothetical protein OEQ53_15145 [Saprospiraceae bacterium]|nr:hypothetical protein [Saprospiraceae bacterium]